MGKKRARNKQMNKHRANPQWKDIVKENKSFEDYYKAQNLVSSNEEWDEFMKFCRKDLPSTFRITKIRGHAKDLLRSLKEGYISKITAEDTKPDEKAPSTKDEEDSAHGLIMEPISWYPEELAWNSNLSRRIIRRSDVLQKLHRFLVEDSECGAITRQEAVSMIPPMLLDVKPHHLVLDMCAAPGSKTAQLIEMMHSNDKNELPTGVVVANDSDHKRCYMLTHQAKRLNTPCVIIVNHDAAIFPKLYSSKLAGEGEQILFDRILCDVPCSGDATLRKNPLIWHRWHSHLGVGLHRLQTRILIRGLELLKIGGRLVYSTCSFNPIENEAVLAGVLRKVDGAVEIVDSSSEIPDLKRKPGMTTWKVIDKRGTEFKNFAEVNVSPTEGFKDTMFPPSVDDAEKLKLTNCMRLYPHLQNTGGFFVAVLEKKKDLPWQKAKNSRNMKYLPWEEDERIKKILDKVKMEADSKIITETLKETENEDDKAVKIKDAVIETTEDVSDSNFNKTEVQNEETNSPRAKRIKRGVITEDPYLFLTDDDEDLKSIRNFYGMSTNLPSCQLLVRSSTEKKRHIYLVSKAVHKIMSSNSNLKIINTGVRIVTRSPFRAGLEQHGTEYRLVQDGIHLAQKYLSNRIVEISESDMIVLITNSDTNVELLREETRSAMDAMDMGCVVWHYIASSSPDNTLTSDIWLCGHNGRKIAQCMLAKEERKHFLRILGAPIPQELLEKVKGKSWGDDNKAVQEKVTEIEEQQDSDIVEQDKTE